MNNLILKNLVTIMIDAYNSMNENPIGEYDGAAATLWLATPSQNQHGIKIYDLAYHAIKSLNLQGVTVEDIELVGIEGHLPQLLLTQKGDQLLIEGLLDMGEEVYFQSMYQFLT